MKKGFLLGILFAAVSLVSFAQEQRKMLLSSGTMLEGKLESNLDVKKAKPGDQVALRVGKALKQENKVIVPAGSRILGRVTEVKSMSEGNGTSKICLLFDRIEGRNLIIPIKAEIISITGASSRAAVDEKSDSDSQMHSASVNSGSSISANSSTRVEARGSDGLLGGVTNTLGSAVGMTVNTAGGLIDSTTAATVKATGTLNNAVSAIRISQSTEASAEGVSVLTLNGGNINLQQGTTFKLRVVESIEK
ncbi:MAG: hypothetical protein D6735_08845 [Acidobacteria bacterium]|nr:MAG: hypothetical protein D6735_08845 [Acidobacteriota bacterium]